MSLISQNIPGHKTKRMDADEPSFLQGNEDNGDGKESNLEIMRMTKRKKARDGEDEKVAVDQEKETKKLENFLFG
ncbi:hypothetical protein RchiOBHm_Chr7g0205881 [Rosa chinensis]|uniref:Uncharacterized protein n=3 Tax=Rosa chinensis TaxID=74649 RepID=A0A2P6P931_ROSCH|nr:hypothetical protein RchiOBHm_Chr7g0205881 [Rosa chinensis]